MLLDGGKAGHAAAVDGRGQRDGVAALAMRQGGGQLARPRGGGLGLGRLVLDLQRARQRGVGHGETLVESDGAAELLLGAVVGRQREVDAGDIGVARLGRGGGQGKPVAILEHG